MNGAGARAAMVGEQLRRRGIADERVLAAMLAVPREEFMPESGRPAAYEDGPQPIGEGQTISQPYIVALMSEALAVSGGERVLEIGTGSGYQTAVLAAMGCAVYSVERLAALSARAGEVLARLGYRAALKVGDGSLGWPEEAPFDRVVVTAAGPKVPQSLLDQLRDGGRLVMPVGGRETQELVLVRREGRAYPRKDLGPCRFVPLKGREGWESPDET